MNALLTEKSPFNVLPIHPPEMWGDIPWQKEIVSTPHRMSRVSLVDSVVPYWVKEGDEDLDVMSLTLAIS